MSTPTQTPARDGSSLIAAERARQVAALGWTPDHDARHPDGRLVQAAGVYMRLPGATWPWRDSRPRLTTDRTRDLAKAGALIAAELDQLTGADPRSPCADGSDDRFTLLEGLEHVRRAERRVREERDLARRALDRVRDALDLPPGADEHDIAAAVHALRVRANPRQRNGVRTMDGGVPGELETCGLCDGDGLLFRPDAEHLPTIAPQDPMPRRECRHPGARAGRCVRPLGCLCGGEGGL